MKPPRPGNDDRATLGNHSQLDSSRVKHSSGEDGSQVDEGRPRPGGNPTPRGRTLGDGRWLDSLNRRTTLLTSRREDRAEVGRRRCSPREGPARAATRDRYPSSEDFVFATDVRSPGREDRAGRRAALGADDLPRESCGREPAKRLAERARPRDSAPEAPRPANTCEHVSETVNTAARRVSSSRRVSVMILPQVHLRKPCYDFYFL